MGESFKNACLGAATTIRASVGQTVTYSRGRQSVSLSAVLIEGRYEIERGGAVEVWEGSDWLVKAADLILAGSAALPRRGDRITDSDGAVYEVVGPGDGPEWQYADVYASELTIHTVRVKA